MDKKAKWQTKTDLFIDIEKIYVDKAAKDADIRTAAALIGEKYKQKHDEEYEALKNSIKINGQIQPIVLRVLDSGEKKEHDLSDNDEGYAVLSGRNRVQVFKDLYKETQKDEYTRILAVIYDRDDNDKRVAAISNFSRVEMSELDKKKIVDELFKKENSMKKVGNILGISKSYVNKLLHMKQETDEIRRPESITGYISDDGKYKLDDIESALASINKIKESNLKLSTRIEALDKLKSIKVLLDYAIKDAESDEKIKKQRKIDKITKDIIALEEQSKEIKRDSTKEKYETKIAEKREELKKLMK